MNCKSINKKIQSFSSLWWVTQLFFTNPKCQHINLNGFENTFTRIKRLFPHCQGATKGVDPGGHPFDRLPNWREARLTVLLLWRLAPVPGWRFLHFWSNTDTCWADWPSERTEETLRPGGWGGGNWRDKHWPPSANFSTHNRQVNLHIKGVYTCLFLRWGLG